MIWIDQIVFWIPQILAVILLIILFRQIILAGEIQVKFLKKWTIVIVAAYILQLLARVFIFYWQLKKSTLGIYLLPGKGTSFFVDNVWANYLLPLVVTIAIDFVLVAVVLLVAHLVKRPFFEEADWLVILLTVFIVGFPNLIVLIVAALILMIIFQIFQSLVFGKHLLNERLKIAPFLIFTSLAILVLGNFSFYINFLSLIGLTKLI